MPTNPPPAGPGADPATDHELVERANGGDAGALRELYLRHRDWVYHLARRYVGRDADAEDVAQEVFAGLIRKFPGFHLSCQLRTYLYPIVHGKSVDLIRRRSRDEGAEANRPSATATAADNATASGPGVEIPAAEIVAGLPEHQREVLLLRFVDGLSLREIGERLGIPTGTVKSRLHLGLEALRVFFAKE